MIVVAGSVFWILLILFGISIVIYFGRAIDLHRAKIDYQDFLKGVINVLDAGNDNEAVAICEESMTPIANVVSVAIAHSNSSARVLRDAVDAQGRVEIGRLDRRMASLAIIAQVAPLLGLLGTVIGFVKVVFKINATEVVARAELLNGAMEALVVAGMGLVVSIVATILYGSLRVRLERTVVDLEAASTQILAYYSGRREERKS